MKYIVCEKIALLATRNIETVTDKLDVTLVGVSDKVTFALKRSDDLKPHIYQAYIENGVYKLSIPASVLRDGVYSVEIADSEKRVTGTQILFYRDHEDGEALKCIPKPLAAGTDMEAMWQGIIGILETVIDHIDEHKNGYEVI